MTEDLDIGIQLLPSGDIAQCGQLPKVAKSSLYKTELCKRFMETGNCRYGNKCQFAHGEQELRGILRHPKYKTVRCKNFSITGTCPYGSRCRFLHEEPPKNSQARVAEEISGLNRKSKISYLETTKGSVHGGGDQHHSLNGALIENGAGPDERSLAARGPMPFASALGQPTVFIPQYGSVPPMAVGVAALGVKPNAVDVTSVDWSMPNIARTNLTVQPENEPPPVVNGRQRAPSHPPVSQGSRTVPVYGEIAEPGSAAVAFNEQLQTAPFRGVVSPEYGVVMRGDRWNGLMFESGTNMVQMRNWNMDESAVPVQAYMVPSIGIGLPINGISGFPASAIHDGAAVAAPYNQYVFYGVGQPGQPPQQLEGAPAEPSRAEPNLEETINVFSSMSLRPDGESEKGDVSNAPPESEATNTEFMESGSGLAEDKSALISGRMDALNANSDPVLSYPEVVGERATKAANPVPIGRGRGSMPAGGQSSLFVPRSEVEDIKGYPSLSL